MTTAGMVGRLVNGLLALVTFLALRCGVHLDDGVSVVVALGVWCAPVAP